MKKQSTYAYGFTLIELLVVIAVIGLLASVIVASLGSARGKARDAERMSDMRQIQIALEFFYDKYGGYPMSDNQGCGGWETPGDGDFISSLKQEGFLPVDMSDPKADDTCGNYRYYVYSPGDYGCLDKYYYILGIVDMESQSNPAKGSPGWSCPTRNWQGEMEWVTGQYR